MLAVLSVVALLVYLAAIVRLQPHRRALAVVADAGLGRPARVSLFAVTGTWVNGYSMVLFSVHMTQHMVLSFVTPCSCCIGAPVTLALRTLPRGHGSAGRPARTAAGRAAQPVRPVVSHPLFTVPLFIASLYGIYFTPLFDALMSSAVGHQLMLAHFVVDRAALLRADRGAGPLAADAGPPRPDARALPAGAVPRLLRRRDHDGRRAGRDRFARPPASWGVDTLGDQGVAGGIVWAFGELPTVLVLAVVFFSWAKSEERQGRAIDRAADRTGDAERLAYNARLRALAAQQQPTDRLTQRGRRPRRAGPPWSP